MTGGFTATEEGVVVGTYKTQYLVTFDQVGVGSDFTGAVLTVDGVDYAVTGLPVSFWWDEGSTHSFSYSSPLVVASNAKQYVYTSTSGLSSAQSDSSFVVTASGSITGNYKTQYYLTMLVSPSGAGTVTPGSGWQDAGTTLNIGVTANSGYVFSSWTGVGSGSYTGIVQTHSITMNGPITETATLTPLTPKWLKQDAIVELKSVLTGNKMIDNQLYVAINEIQDSLSCRLWVSDIRLNPCVGACVFEEEEDAVQILQGLITQKTCGTCSYTWGCGYGYTWVNVPDNVKQECLKVIGKLLTADELLAQQAIADAKASGKFSTCTINAALAEITKAQNYASNGYFVYAIEHYENAWRLVTSQLCNYCWNYCGNCWNFNWGSCNNWNFNYCSWNFGWNCGNVVCTSYCHCW